MKTIIPLTALAALVASSTAFAQTPAFSKPSGYTSQTLAPNAFNLVGINVQKPSLVSGSFTAVNGSILSSAGVDFGAVLPAGKMYVLEITSGVAAGTVQEFVTFSGSTLTLPAPVAGVAISDNFTVRGINTLQELFPSGKLVVSGNLNANAADKVWVPQGNGSYIRYFVKGGASNPGWHTTPNGSSIGETLAITADIPVLYTDAIIVQTSASPITPLVLTGEVKTTGSNTMIVPGFNLITTVPPAGLTLFTSGLQGQLTPSGNLNANAADKIWVPQGNGTYIRYFFKGGASNPGWHTTSNGSAIGEVAALTTDVALPPGTFIQRITATNTVFKFNVPSSYSSL
jgi:hypothetical protein